MKKSSHWILTYLAIPTHNLHPKRKKTNSFLEFEFLYMCHTQYFDIWFFYVSINKTWKYEKYMYNMHVRVLSRYLQIKINVIRGYMHVCPLHITVINNYMTVSTPYLFIHNSRKYWIYYELLFESKTSAINLCQE